MVLHRHHGGEPGIGFAQASLPLGGMLFAPEFKKLNIDIKNIKIDIDIIKKRVYDTVTLVKKEGPCMPQVISRCPVCGRRLKVVKLQCEHCETAIENEFTLTRFDYLTPEELAFAETFLKCRGNIKEVEKELKISYPTVRSRLDQVIASLGGRPAPAGRLDTQRKREILDALERGELTAEEAVAQMKETGGD